MDFCEKRESWVLRDTWGDLMSRLGLLGLWEHIERNDVS